LHGLLSGLSQALDLPGSLPPFAPMHMLMANLLGLIVCVWAVLRIRDPQQVYGRYDAVGRFLFATWQLYALLHVDPARALQKGKAPDRAPGLPGALIKKRAAATSPCRMWDGDSHERVIHRLFHSICAQAPGSGISKVRLCPKGDKPR
jgi:hypothetical protein